MPLSPAPKTTVSFFTSAVLLFGGSFGGTHLTAMVAPYSQLSGLVGFFMFPMAFMASMRLWSWVNAILTSGLPFSQWVKNTNKPIPRFIQRIIGACTFVLTSIIISVLSGLILTPPAMQIAVDPGYNILIPAGTLYGVLCWILIQLGYLQQADV